MPEQQTAIVVLTNSGRGSAAYPAIEEWLLEHVCGLRQEPPAKTKLSEDVLRNLAGHYERPGYEIDVTVSDGLRLDFKGPHPLTGDTVPYPSQSLAAVSATEFVVRDGPREDERVEFILNDDGHPRFIRMHGRLANRIDGK